MSNEELAQALADLDFVERRDVIRRAEQLAEAAYSDLPTPVDDLAGLLEPTGRWYGRLPGE